MIFPREAHEVVAWLGRAFFLGPVVMIHAVRTQRQARLISISRSILLSASYLVLSVMLYAPKAMVQAAAESQSAKF